MINCVCVCPSVINDNIVEVSIFSSYEPAQRKEPFSLLQTEMEMKAFIGVVDCVGSTVLRFHSIRPNKDYGSHKCFHLSSCLESLKFLFLFLLQNNDD